MPEDSISNALIPSLSSGPVGSRFVSQNEVDVARARREEQWKAAYARLGQAPPPPQQEDSYDGRSLAEKLAANKIAKQEEWEEKTKLANQFRALEEDEIMFLDSIRERQEAEERQRRELDGEEVKNFKEAVAARISNNAPPLPSAQPVKTNAPMSKPSQIVPKKDIKKQLKGVIVKKKPKADLPKPPADKAEPKLDDADKDEQPNAKRRKVSTS